MRRPHLASLALGLVGWPAYAGGLPPGLEAALRPRLIGPPGISGRVTALAVTETNPRTFFVGAAAGGVWKTTNGGDTFQPVFDAQPAASIGALSLFQPNPLVVWAGTGECAVRNSVSSGNGVYRSVDGGNRWVHLGLEKSERIARIALHPTDPDVALVAALGPLWGEGGERGVYRTEDGGRSWVRTLAVDDKTGAVDVSVDPSRPERVLAAMWQVRRWPWTFVSGGPGSGLFSSADGGITWSRLGSAAGLPAGEMGRISLARSRSHPATVYALIELRREGALLRSDDGGQSWREIARGANRFPRPFYFREIVVDPTNPDRLYHGHFDVDRSDDGGATMEWVPARGIHPDIHALWIDPADPNHLYIGTDGGVYVSHDGAATARWLPNLPLAQFYAVSVDGSGQVHGGTQDNGAWRGPITAWAVGGGAREDWIMVGGGDSMETLGHPGSSDSGYTMQALGGLVRWRVGDGEWRAIQPPGADVPLRFDWNAPLAVTASGTLFVGSQFVHRSTDRGETWSRISADLTTNKPEWQQQDSSGGLTPDVSGAENFTALSALAISPATDEEIWAGSDDGRVHVTSDGGRRWRDTSAAIPALRRGARVQRLVALKGGAALLLVDDHRQGDPAPYVYETTDLGAHWTRLPTDGVSGWALSVLAPCPQRDTLVLGTEHGLWLTLDHGASWAPWRQGLGAAPVAGMAMHDGDLVLGTHGRGLYVIDDFVAVCGLPATADGELRVLGSATRPQRALRTVGGGRTGDLRGVDRAYGAIVTLWAPASASEDHPASIVVRDEQGAIVRSFEKPLAPGVNRITWSFEHDALWRPARPTGRGPLPPVDTDPGPEVTSGDYRLTVRLGEAEVSTPVAVRSLGNGTAGDRWAFVLELARLQKAVTLGLEELFRWRSDLTSLAERVPALRGRVEGTLAQIDVLERRAQRRRGDPLGEARHDLRNRLYNAEYLVSSSLSTPGSGVAAEVRELAADCSRWQDALTALGSGEVASLRAQAGAAAAGLFEPD